MLNEGNQIHNFISSSGSGTVNNYGSSSGSDFLTTYGSGSSSHGSYGSGFGSTTLSKGHEHTPRWAWNHLYLKGLSSEVSIRVTVPIKSIV